MFKKILVLAFAALVMSACSSMGTKNGGAITKDRAVPSYFANGETAAAFKVDSVIRDMPLQGVLIVKKTDNSVYSIKIMGPLGAKLVDGVMDDDGVTYDYVLPDINTGLIKNRFEKFIFALLRPAGDIKKAHFNKDGTLAVKRKVGDSTFTYTYDENAAYPSKMQGGAISMGFGQYQPYFDGSLPYALTYYDSLANVSLGLTLISIR
ncbi:MAG: hypothetical protein FWF35_05280 [Elusimicrobia bacterium]|nr:hypothetical protein [Elusimicrobiota bacterium]